MISLVRGRRYNRLKKSATGFEDRNISGGQNVPRTSETLATQYGVDLGKFGKKLKIQKLLIISQA